MTASKQTNAYFLSRIGLALFVSWANGCRAALAVMRFHEFSAGNEIATQVSGCRSAAKTSLRDSFGHQRILANEERRPQ